MALNPRTTMRKRATTSRIALAFASGCFSLEMITGGSFQALRLTILSFTEQCTILARGQPSTLGES